MAETALKMRSIVKTYGGVPVLKEVDFTVERGTIHALLGENGAGKTTLMNILGGVTPMDRGSVELFGKKARINSTRDAREHGIAFIHQELNVINDLAVYENMFLGNELHGRFKRLDRKRMCEACSRVFRQMNVDIDPRAMMGSLETSYKQIVEIAKSLLRNARLIIMDEPTTSLTQKEIGRVFAIMKGLTREQKVTIIFISHKLGEVVDFCDSFTVLRNGEKVASGFIRQEDGSKISQVEIAKMMVGRDVLGVEVYEPHPIGGPLLEVENLSVEGYARNVSFTLHSGEILGITGLLGDGKDELARCLFGDLPRSGGSVKLEGRPIEARHPSDARKMGIGMLPSNRKENAIIKDLSVQANTTIVSLDRYQHGIKLSLAEEAQAAESARQRLSIKADKLTSLITSLSGGNQQKVVLAKWLDAEPKVMILSNPTQGVDVGAKNEIYAEIMKLARQGIGIIITSGEAQEIIKTCDRALVMYHGELRGELTREEMSDEAIMILCTGGKLAV